MAVRSDPPRKARAPLLPPVCEYVDEECSPCRRPARHFVFTSRLRVCDVHVARFPSEATASVEAEQHPRQTYFSF